MAARAPANLHVAKDDNDFGQLLETKVKSSVVVLNFHADWAPQCAQMNEVFSELAKLHSNVDFIMIEAEELPDTSETFEVSAVPSFVVIKNGRPVERVNGANALELTNAVEKYAKTATSSNAAPASADKAASSAPEPLSAAAMDARLKQLINMAPMVLFMKGTPQQPKCGFSRQTIELLSKYNARYSTFNILADEQVRQALKVFSNWPTYPQLYINGELIGGLDILKELDATGELQELIPTDEDLNTRLGKLIKRAPLMIFIKGTPSAPRCGFSKQLIGILSDLKATYDYFDILTDDEVRQGLKVFSDWPTYPQVYIKGDLVGGLDIVKEMIASGDFQSMLDDALRV
ncbi:Grx4 family monothiol glutaredoxin [Allomyces macrogynus ATCC 38327]|uniref:Grx4 family monothiol glutaredoxin n=1 Tax=Allomyces macrogynus (strain ATCC 38327) TaxID=578462 RepID=A0A0L0T7X9_ALLM3|nr:Grx4 family monothiol glutaredoxin [Allomyces macrogynus ATCC 38327]|eukprot:KNE70825.1 Grx4 family monothiol glutaredoxin [Allomyces macrogynus ATCC 38327]